MPQANSSSGLLSWKLTTLVPNHGPWTNTPLTKLQVVDEEQEEEDRRLREQGTPIRRRSSSSSSSRPEKSKVPPTFDNVRVGSKVIAEVDGQKQRCIVTQTHALSDTVDLKVDPDQYAPVAQTCTFTLKIPAYTSVQVAIRQLRRAIVEEGMHLD